MTLTFVRRAALQPIVLVMPYAAVAPRPVQEMAGSAAAPAPNLVGHESKEDRFPTIPPTSISSDISLLRYHAIA